MFASSTGVLLAHLGAYLFLPLIIGIFGSWLLLGHRFRGWLFYMLSWFIGVGILSYGLFLLQFVRFGIDWAAYLIILIFLVVLLVIKMFSLRADRSSLFETLHIGKYSIERKIKNKWQKGAVIILILFIIAYIAITFFFVTHFPSYGDDAFGNRHLPVMNILYDGGVKIFGAAGEILGRGRLGYPIMIRTMQAFMAHVVGGYNDMYVNLFQWLAFTLFAAFIGVYVYQKKRHLLAALIGPALIMSLPLMFMHVTQGYMDLLSAIYTSLAVIGFYEWIEDDGHAHDLILGVTMLGIVSYIKNDGFVVYMIGTLIALAIYLIIHRKQAREKLRVILQPSVWIPIVGIILFFIVPFTFLKSYYNLGFNQAAGANTGLGLASTLHREIFPVIRHAIRSMNNYSLAPLLFLAIIILYINTHKKLSKQTLFLLLAPVIILGLFLLVFLVTENYKFVLDQTTVNRVFTMVLVIFLSVISFFIDTTSAGE